MAGATAGAFALPYAAVAGLLGLARDAPLTGLGAGNVLVGAAALLLASVVGAVGVGHGLRVFTAGVTVGFGGILGALLSFATSGSGAASVVLVCVVGGISVAPLVAVRLGKLPIPVVSAVEDMLATDPRADGDDLRAAVIRGGRSWPACCRASPCSRSGAPRCSPRVRASRRHFSPPWPDWRCSCARGSSPRWRPGFRC